MANILEFMGRFLVGLICIMTAPIWFPIYVCFYIGSEILDD